MIFRTARENIKRVILITLIDKLFKLTHFQNEYTLFLLGVPGRAPPNVFIPDVVVVVVVVFLSCDFNIWKEHIKVSSTLIKAPKKLFFYFFFQYLNYQTPHSS
jgi:hypothetical protein